MQITFLDKIASDHVNLEHKVKVSKKNMTIQILYAYTVIFK